MNHIIGQSLGRYHIIEKLGQGGMAVVYKAFDTRLECDVAVKVIRTDQLAPAVLERALVRFEHEAKGVARLTHANIVKVTDYGEYEGMPFLVMPYLPGGTLKQYLQDHGRMEWQEAVRLLLPIADALGYAHEQNIIHRDVKPSNILLTSTGQPMLTDFGVAKIVDLDVTRDLTGTSATVGTPEYMAPEQVMSKTVDQRADIYALGVVLFEMVIGRRPFEADTPMAVLIMQAGEPLPRPGKYVEGLPEKVEQVLFKALAKKPEDRYQSMGEFATAMSRLEKNDSPHQSFIPDNLAKKGSEKPQKLLEKSTGIAGISPKNNSQGLGKKKYWLWLAGLCGFFLVAFVFLKIFDGVGNSQQQIAETNPTEPALVPLTATTVLKPNETRETLPTMTLTLISSPTVEGAETTIMGEITSPVKCRKGPSEYFYGYDIVLDSQKVEIIGKNKDASWFNFIADEEQVNCWTIREKLDFSDDVSKLKEIPDPTINEEIYYGIRYAYCENHWNGNTCTGKYHCWAFYSYYVDGEPFSKERAVELTQTQYKWILSNAIYKYEVFPYTLSSKYAVQSGFIPCPMNQNGQFYGW